MSFGALSGNAIEALNGGAALGGFAHDTGEGGISPYHLHGGDLIWEIGSGYFGCRDADGTFDAATFAEKARFRRSRPFRSSCRRAPTRSGRGAARGQGQRGDRRDPGVPVGRTVVSDVGATHLSPVVPCPYRVAHRWRRRPEVAHGVEGLQHRRHVRCRPSPAAHPMPPRSMIRRALLRLHQRVVAVTMTTLGHGRPCSGATTACVRAFKQYMVRSAGTPSWLCS